MTAMTQPEVDAWFDMLAPTDAQRITAIKDLLKNANEDHMSVEDRAICVGCLGMLQARQRKSKVS